MKNSKILVAVMVFMMFSYAKAEEIKVDFDGRNSISINFIEAIAPQISNTDAVIPLKESELEMPVDINKNDLSKNLNVSIMHSIKYCEKNNIDEFITDNLKKLLVYGTNDEKLQFMKSEKYTFPQKFNKFRRINFEDYLPTNKGQFIQVCEEKNCRTERVCGRKEVCEWISDIICSIASGVAGDAIGAGPVVGGIAGTVVCRPVTKYVCRDVEDCQDIEKCDSVCHTEYVSDIQPGQCVTNQYGQTECS